MNKAVLLSTAFVSLGTLGTAAVAQEQGRVISSTPVVQQVTVPRQVCNNQQVVTQGQKSGAGAAIGAIAGGAMGNAIGNGSGRAAATMLGLFGGAILGNNIEGGGQPQVQNVQQCHTQTFYENRTVAYNVVYEYGGRQYNVQMPNDPGPTIQLQVTPVGSQQQAPVNQPQTYAPPAYSPQTYVQPAVVESYTTYQPTYVNSPAVVYTGYPSYRPYYPPIGVSLNLGYSRGYGHGHRGHGHGHWR
jgi:uncharacterized protein YcfJ